MALRSDYSGQRCSLARALEVVGERWTLLIVRDAFYGVRRFGDFAAHLGLPRAVLADRLRTLEAEGVLERMPADGARGEYQLTDKGRDLWPVIHSLIAWGDKNYAPAGPLRLFAHATDTGTLEGHGQCEVCGQQVPPQEISISPGPGLSPAAESDDVVTAALASAHRMLDPLVTRHVKAGG